MSHERAISVGKTEYKISRSYKTNVKTKPHCLASKGGETAKASLKLKITVFSLPCLLPVFN